MGKTLFELLESYADDTIVFIDRHSLFGTEYSSLVYRSEEFTKSTIPFELQNLTVSKFYDDEDILTVYLDTDADDADVRFVKYPYFGRCHV